MTRNVIIKKDISFALDSFIEAHILSLIVEFHYIICIKHVCTYDTDRLILFMSLHRTHKRMQFRTRLK